MDENVGIGTKREDFSITFSLSDVLETEYFVARERELAEIHGTLRSGNGSHRTVVLCGPRGIGIQSFSKVSKLALRAGKTHPPDHSPDLNSVLLNITDT
jgi:hypothetical protein